MNVNMSNRKNTVIVFYLIAKRYGIRDVQARAEALISRLSILPLALCRCSLPLSYKRKYDDYVALMQKGEGKSFMRTRAGI